MIKFIKKQFKLFAASASLLTIIVISPVNSYAYEYWGPFYNRYEMSSGISSGIYMNNAISSYSYNGTIYDFGTAFNGAFNEWNNLTESEILNSLHYSGTTKIRAEGQDYGNLNLLGWVEMRSGGMYGTVVGSASAPPSQSWDFAWAYLNAYDIDESRLSYNQYRGVAVHEVGHALGLSHETDGTPSVMNDEDFIANGWLVPQQDDINGVNNLY